MGAVEAAFGGRYRLVRRLGAGGMGEVWLAADEELDGRPVAIKVMHSAMLADAQDVARFQREMRLASRMNHPNIVTVFTTGADNGVPFMVMEYLKGSDLGRMPFPSPAEDVARFGRQTCAALAYAHGLDPGVVHRDIKPANLFVCDDGQVKVTDFGIAKALSGTRLSATGSWIGTLPYMAPEHWLGEPAAFGNDIWAVGCVLYELLSGRLPRSYATPPEYLAAAVRGERIAPLPATAGALSWLPDAVMAMLQPDLRDRPTAAQCVQMLSGPAAYATAAAPMSPVPSATVPPAFAAFGATGTSHSPQHALPTSGEAPLRPPPARPARRSLRRGLVLPSALVVVAAMVLVAGYIVTRGGGHSSDAGDKPGVSASTPTASAPRASALSASRHSGSHPAASDPSTSDPSSPAPSSPAPSTSTSKAPAHRASPKAVLTSWSEPARVSQGIELTSVSCAAPDLCAAVNSGGGIYVYNGTSWSSEASTSNLLGAVSCPSTSFCATAGYDDSGGNVFTFDGGSWSAPDLVDPGYKLHSVSCASASFCAAGASVNVFVYSGGSWSAPDAVDPNDANGNGVESVSCASSSFCVAVDAIGNALTYANGSWSSPRYIDNGEQLKSVSCASSSFCVAVDAIGNALTYANGSWSSRQVDDVSLDSVSCASPSSCVAVDTRGDALTYTNGSWSSPRAIDGAAALESVSCTSPSFCAAVDLSGNAFFMR
jgi:serine/threonine protein kinase